MTGKAQQYSISVSPSRHPNLYRSLESGNWALDGSKSRSQHIADLAEAQIIEAGSIDSDIADLKTAMAQIQRDVSNILAGGVKVVSEVETKRSKLKSRLGKLTQT